MVVSSHMSNQCLYRVLVECIFAFTASLSLATCQCHLYSFRCCDSLSPLSQRAKHDTVCLTEAFSQAYAVICSVLSCGQMKSETKCKKCRWTSCDGAWTFWKWDAEYKLPLCKFLIFQVSLHVSFLLFLLRLADDGDPITDGMSPSILSLVVWLIFPSLRNVCPWLSAEQNVFVSKHTC